MVLTENFDIIIEFLLGYGCGMNVDTAIVRGEKKSHLISCSLD